VLVEADATAGLAHDALVGFRNRVLQARGAAARVPC
jgi:hypothetical protein